MPIPYPAGVRCKKSAVQIAPALVQAQTCLTLSRALARQNPRGKLALPIRPKIAHRTSRCPRQQLRLVKASLPASRLEERHRNHEHRLRQIRNRSDLGSNQHTQPLGHRLPSLVLQQVEQRPHRALAQPMRDCPFKGGTDKPAGAAQKFLTRPLAKIGDTNILATSETERSRL